MIIFIRISRKIVIIITILIILCCLGIYFYAPLSIFTSSDIKASNQGELEKYAQELFNQRNQAILTESVDVLDALYDRNAKQGLFAYEHELKKMKYLHQWSKKQSAKFEEIESKVFLRKIDKKDSCYQLNLAATTRYKYIYENQGQDENDFWISSYHIIDLRKQGNDWLIIKEWYTDPFADSLNLDEKNLEKVNKLIQTGMKKDLSNISEKRKAALNYADDYCGVARPPEYSFHYNKEYKNYNGVGGDCTNFASQVMFEGGQFSKTSTWSYNKSKAEATKAWVSAHGFNEYMIGSKRGSLIARGTYEEILSHSYQLLPGDYIAYEKKGKVAHISIVTGVDSQGYILVNSHNADRYRVPWDLGWSDKGIKMWLVRVNFE